MEDSCDFHDIDEDNQAKYEPQNYTHIGIKSS
jgi:hypothetical protein